jgi:hypothetical protein
MPENDNEKDNDVKAEEEVEDLAPEEGEATEVKGGRRVAFPG